MAQIKADEITALLKEQIANYDAKMRVDEVGTVITLGDGIARLHGLDKVMAGELLEFPHDIAGLAMSLEEDQVGAVLLGDYTEIREGDQVKRTGKILSVPVGDAMIGRVVNALGQPIDDKGPIQTRDMLPVERLAPGVIARQPVREPMMTGLKAIDSMIPDRPRTARADHRRPPDGKNRGRARLHHQQREKRPDLHLLRDRAEALLDRGGGADAGRVRRDGAHHRGGRVGVRAGADAVSRSLRGLRHGRVFPRQGPPRAHHLRRSLQARHRLSRDFAAAAPSAGPRSVSGRCFLSSLTPAGARREAERRERRRIADRAAHHRDAGGRRFGLHPDQRYFDHRRTDLPSKPTCSTPASAPRSMSASPFRAWDSPRPSRPSSRWARR